MKPEEYVELLKLISKDHNMMSKNGKSIKYVSSNFDTRDNSIYRVSLREWFSKETVVFVVSGHENLFDTIKEWLVE